MKNKITLSIAIIAACSLIAWLGYRSMQKQKRVPSQESSVDAQALVESKTVEQQIDESHSNKAVVVEPIDHSSEPESAPLIVSLPAGESILEKTDAQTEAPEVVDLTPYALSDAVPESLADFRSWSTKKQLQYVTRLMNNPNVDEVTLEFFRAALHDPNISQHVRNNMANALIAQERGNPELYRDFIQMIHDEEQSERWRAYSIQFLAETRKYAGNQKAIDEELTALARGDDLLAGQAQMMLSTLEGRGEIELGEDFDELQAAVLRKGLETEGNATSSTQDDVEKKGGNDASTSARITALSLLGRRKSAEHRDIIRQYAAKECPERRVAIAALGQIAHPDDKAIIELALENGDTLTKKAAQAALKNFE